MYLILRILRSVNIFQTNGREKYNYILAIYFYRRIL